MCQLRDGRGCGVFGQRCGATAGWKVGIARRTSGASALGAHVKVLKIHAQPLESGVYVKEERKADRTAVGKPLSQHGLEVLSLKVGTKLLVLDDDLMLELLESSELDDEPHDRVRVLGCGRAHRVLLHASRRAGVSTWVLSLLWVGMGLGLGLGWDGMGWDGIEHNSHYSQKHNVRKEDRLFMARRVGVKTLV